MDNSIIQDFEQLCSAFFIPQHLLYNQTFDMLSPETQQDKMTLITLARSNVSNVNNMVSEHHHSIQVSENTDFEMIFNITEGYVEERHHYFVAHDLLKLYNQGKYKNSTKEWWKKYQTTIVMPIRSLNIPSESNDRSYDTMVNSEYNILGMLCIDSKRKNIFIDKKRKFIIEYLKGLSDILYIYLAECERYYKSFKRSEKNV